MYTAHTHGMTTSRTLKVRIPITVEVDLDAWADEYSVDDTAAEVRADVKRHIENLVRQELASLGLAAGE